MEAPKDIRERVEKLRETIRRERALYHVENRQTMSDAARDSLMHELKQLEEKYPKLVTPDSPTQRVAGKPLAAFQKVRHVVPQWSLDDAFTEEELRAFDARVKKIAPDATYVCELKIDGFHIVLTYQKGLLATAATRGDGQVGEDVTQNVKTIDSIPLRLAEPVDLVVEGEILLLKSDFERLNREQKKRGEPLFANPRNAAAGTIRQLDPRMVSERRLSSFLYDIDATSADLPHMQDGELEWLRALGFVVNPHFARARTIDEVIAYWHAWQKRAPKENYWIDGIVVKVRERGAQEKLGYTGKGPRFAVAGKFPADQATTRVRDIVVQVGRTGALTPVAELDPVLLAGTTVSRATLHNADQIAKLDVRTGDTVVIQKAGDIIPEVLSVIPSMRTGKEKPFRFPSQCPVCGGTVTRAEGEAAHRCANPKCPAKHRRGLSHFVSRAAFDIHHLGPKVIDLLADEGLLSTPADLFHLRKEEIAALPRMGEKSAENLLAAINARQRISLPRFLNALGIPQVGEETAIRLADQFGTLTKLRAATEEELVEAPDIGETIAHAIRLWFDVPANRKLLDDLLSLVHIEKPTKRTKPTKLSLRGASFVLTGTLPGLSREEAKALIRAHGGRVVESVSKRTKYVLAGADPGSKLAQAQALGIMILDEAKFLRMMEA